MNIILLGAPGSGKGTQAQALMDEQGLLHLSSGDLFRENIRGGTELGRQAQAYMNRGDLVPDDVTIEMIRDRLRQPDAAKGVLFDGFPRTVAQAAALDLMLKSLGSGIDGAILIEVPEAELVERLSGRRICRECQTPFHLRFKPFESCPTDRCQGEFLYQREDDRPETVRQRLEVYRRQTAPVIDYYQEQSKLYRVDGLGRPNAITRRMKQAILALHPIHGDGD